jgi:hypothetical protein
MEQVAGWRKITNVVHLIGSKIYSQVHTADSPPRATVAWCTVPVTFTDSDERLTCDSIWCGGLAELRGMKWDYEFADRSAQLARRRGMEKGPLLEVRGTTASGVLS